MTVCKTDVGTQRKACWQMFSSVYVLISSAYEQWS